MYGLTKAQLIAKIDVAMGGRAAEELGRSTYILLRLRIFSLLIVQI